MNATSQQVTILNFDDFGDDRIDLSGFDFVNDLSDVHASTSGADVVLDLVVGDSPEIVLIGTTLASVTASDFIF